MLINYNKKGQVALLVLVLITIAAIFFQSSLNSSKSFVESNAVGGVLENILGTVIKPSQPSEETQKPSEETQKPSEETQKPSEETQKPSEETQKPSEETQKPSEETQKPSEETQKPSEETQKPSEETQAPSNGDNQSEGEDKENSFKINMSRLRKAAHFIEHGVLGLEMFFLVMIIEKNRKSSGKLALRPISLLLTLYFGMFIALVDETIQIFSERGYSIKDVWIDVSGYATFTLVLYLIVTVKRFLRKSKISSD